MQRFRSPVVLVCVGVLILTVISLVALTVVKVTKTSPLASKFVQVVPEKTLLRNTVKSVFNSKDEVGILAYLDLAFTQKQPSQSYLYMRKAFGKMITSYNSFKAPEKKLAMTRLKTYVSTLPNYKENDFLIPK